MRQSEIDRAVARATGESRSTVAGIGFSLWEPEPAEAAETQLHVALECPGCGRLVRLTPQQFQDPGADAECERCDVAYAYEPAELFAVETPVELLAAG